MKLVIAGGGTGGHLFSGIAVAERWLEKKGDVVFIGTTKGLEKDIVPKRGFKLLFISVSSLKGGRFLSRLKTFLGLPKSFWESFKYLRQIKPSVILGIGGYASGPTVLMGRIMGIKTAVIDQNSVPGLTNRILGKWVHRVYLTFENSITYFKPKKIRMYGNPVIKERIPQNHQLTLNPVTLCVCGGSQGAKALNEAFVKSIKDICKKYPEIRLIHQTGQADYESILEFVKKENMTNIKIKPFFESMEEIYQNASLVISRSGAGTLTELSLWGLPSILIPYPYAADNHQMMNAQDFEKVGASVVIEQKNLTSEILTKTIFELLESKEKLKHMGEKAKQLAKPRASLDVSDDLFKLCRE